MIVRLLLSIFLAALLSALARAQPAQLAAPGVLLRSSAEPQTAMVGQRVAFYVDVLFRDDMPAPPRVVAPELPGAQIFRFESQGVTMREQIDGANYVGQRFEFAVYARRPGQYVIPPAAIAILGRNGEQISSAASAPAGFRAIVPEGFDASQLIIASAKVTMTQEWSPATNSAFKVGGAIKRTIRREAEDVPGLAMQPPDQTAQQGVRVYAEAPDIDDSANRGAVTGRRVDRLTYVFEAAGDFTLPAISQAWWDLSSASARAAAAAGAQIHVAAIAGRAGRDAQGPLAWSARRWIAAGALAVVLLAIVAFARRLRPRLAIWVSDWSRRQSESEGRAFRDLQRACDAGDARETYDALQRWRTAIARAPEEDSDLARDACEPLERALFAPRGGVLWTAEHGRALALAIGEARRGLLPQRRPPARQPLPPLNPARV